MLKIGSLIIFLCLEGVIKCPFPTSPDVVPACPAAAPSRSQARRGTGFVQESELPPEDREEAAVGRGTEGSPVRREHCRCQKCAFQHTHATGSER